MISETSDTPLRPSQGSYLAVGILSGVAFFANTGCQSSFEQIDLKVESLIAQTNEDFGGGTRTPKISSWDLSNSEQRDRSSADVTREWIPTSNPSAEDMVFRPSAASDTEQVIARLNKYNEMTGDIVEFALNNALAYATSNSREYRFAEEEYVLSALRLLIERHQWGPRFFNDVSATISGDADDGLFDTSLRLVNEFRITQRLPYGGTISARALARATENLNLLVAGEEVSSADIILQANIPLLRGAGTVARESRIQAERDLIYEARDFERFRRQFLFDISQNFLNLVVQKRSLRNSERNVESLEEVEKREMNTSRAGRTPPFDAARAENRTIEGRDNLNRSRESFRLSVDRFKIRIGMPIDQNLVIFESGLGLPVPETDLIEAVRVAMSNRLDLQTQRDRLDDSRRAVANARNNLLPDLNFDASVTLPTDDNLDRSATNFEREDLSFQAGVTFGLPLDREIERLNLRQSQIRLERARRDYERFRDDVALAVREAVRGIDSSLFSLQIQERGIEIAKLQQANIDADPGQANARDKAEAVNDLLDARNRRDAAIRDLDLDILRYLRDTGQLRLNPDGSIKLLKGMSLTNQEDQEPAEENPANTSETPPGS